MTNKIDKKWFQDKFAERGLSQNEFGKKIGLDPSYISHLLGGKKRFNIETIELFANNLGVPIEYVIKAIGLVPQSGTQGVKLRGTVDGEGRITPTEGEEFVNCEVVLPFNVEAIQIQAHGSFMDGWVLFYLPESKTAAADIRSLCVVNNQYVGVLKRGYQNKQSFNLLFDSNQLTLVPERASPVIWIMP